MPSDPITSQRQRLARVWLERWLATREPSNLATLEAALAADAVGVDLPGGDAQGAVFSGDDGARWAVLSAVDPRGALAGGEGDDEASLVERRAAARGLVATARALTGLANLARYGFDLGFRVEELFAARVVARSAAALDALVGYLRRVAGPRCAVLSVLDPAAPHALQLDAALRERTEGAAAPDEPRYALGADGKVRLEALEFHVVEHCNLRCSHCCNMSPYVAERTMPASEVLAQARALARHVHADVFKIMGGEPLLHPELPAIVAGLRETGIADIVRLFTNGLLLHTMPEAFWRSVDQVTVSSYASAPARPEHLREVERLADRYGVVLNVKEVDRFSQVLRAERVDDPAELQAVFDQCWLKHRCLNVRDGRFFKCTRAAYTRDFHERLAVPARLDAQAAERAWRADGVPVDDERFAERLVAYLNDDKPLAACAHCYGSSGPVVPHTQLTKRAVRAGLLHDPEAKGARR